MVGVGLVQILVSVFLYAAYRSMRREITGINKETFGLLRKLEGLTASKREKVLREYDRMLEDLSNRLPTTIAAQASEKIFETESRILTRLAELEPILKEDKASQRRMDELIKTMEQLEQSLVASTAETVKKVFVESRSNLFDDEQNGPLLSPVIAWSHTRDVL